MYNAFRIKLWRTQAFSAYFHKMAAIGQFGFLIFAKIDKVIPLRAINGCVKYEFDMGTGVRKGLKNH